MAQKNISFIKLKPASQKILNKHVSNLKMSPYSIAKLIHLLSDYHNVDYRENFEKFNVQDILDFGLENLVSQHFAKPKVLCQAFYALQKVGVIDFTLEEMLDFTGLDYLLAIEPFQFQPNTESELKIQKASHLYIQDKLNSVYKTTSPAEQQEQSKLVYNDIEKLAKIIKFKQSRLKMDAAKEVPPQEITSSKDLTSQHEDESYIQLKEENLESE